MGFKIKDTLEVSIYFNGVEYPTAVGNVLNYLKVYESSKIILPTCVLSISDGSHTLLNTGLTDGTVITLQIISKKQILYRFTFMLYSYEQYWSGTCYTYEIDGYLNKPKYWAGTQENPLTGSSTSILQQVATVCKLDFEGDSTADNRTYSALNRRYNAVVRNIANTAWGGSNCCYKAGVTLSGKLRFKNVLALTQPVAKFICVGSPSVQHNSEQNIPVYVISDFRITSNGGSFNSSGVYSAAMEIQSVVEPTEWVDKMTVNTGCRNPNVGLTVVNEMGKGMVLHSPISATEGWNKNNKARYYNKRASALFSIESKFICPDPTNLTLFDPVHFVAASPDGHPTIPISGNYIISSRTIQIKGPDYTEIIIGTRMGTNGSVISGRV